MTIHIEKEKLEKFNNFVNDNNLFDEYKDIDGRNKWNIICSCMDWIDTAITYIESFEEFNNNPHISSMQIYSLLSAADMISESISFIEFFFRLQLFHLKATKKSLKAN